MKETNTLEKSFINIHGALANAIESRLQASVLYELTLLELYVNRSNRSEELLPIQISTGQLAKHLNMNQPNVVRAIKQLEKLGWLEIKTGVTGKASSYLVNVDQIVKSVATYAKLTE